MKIWICLLAIFGLVISPAALAQVDTNHNAIPNAELFGIRIDGSQTFYGRVRGINSASVQTYMTPSFEVTELVIDMIHSPLQLRIYSTTPLNLADPAARAATAGTAQVPFSGPVVGSAGTALNRLSDPVRDRVGSTTNTLPVVKNYPLTTHSKTIEYKLPSPDHVQALFRAFTELWLAMPDAVEEARTADQESQTTGRISPLSRVIFSVEN